MLATRLIWFPPLPITSGAETSSSHEPQRESFWAWLDLQYAIGYTDSTITRYILVSPLLLLLLLLLFLPFDTKGEKRKREREGEEPVKGRVSFNTCALWWCDASADLTLGYMHSRGNTSSVSRRWFARAHLTGSTSYIYTVYYID